MRERDQAMSTNQDEKFLSCLNNIADKLNEGMEIIKVFCIELLLRSAKLRLIKVYH